MLVPLFHLVLITLGLYTNQFQGRNCCKGMLRRLQREKVRSSAYRCWRRLRSFWLQISIKYNHTKKVGRANIEHCGAAAARVWFNWVHMCFLRARMHMQLYMNMFVSMCCLHLLLQMIAGSLQLGPRAKSPQQWHVVGCHRSQSLPCLWRNTLADSSGDECYNKKEDHRTGAPDEFKRRTVVGRRDQWDELELQLAHYPAKHWTFSHMSVAGESFRMIDSVMGSCDWSFSSRVFRCHSLPSLISGAVHQWFRVPTSNSQPPGNVFLLLSRNLSVTSLLSYSITYLSTPQRSVGSHGHTQLTDSASD